MSTLTPPAENLVLVLWNPTRFGLPQKVNASVGYVNNDRPLTLETAQELTFGLTPFKELSADEKAALGAELGALKGLWLPKSSAVGNAVFHVYCTEANLRSSNQLSSRFIIEDEEPENGYCLTSELLAQTVVPDTPPLQTTAQLLAEINEELGAKAPSAALDAKADLVDGKVPESQLPEAQHDVIEYANLAAFPPDGETGKIYLARNTNLAYRFNGNPGVYVQVGGSSTIATAQISDASTLGRDVIKITAPRDGRTLLGINTALTDYFLGDIYSYKWAFNGDSTIDAANNGFYARLFNVTMAYSGAGTQTLAGYHASAYGAFSGMTMADDRDGTTNPSRPANFSTTNIINQGHNGMTLAAFVAGVGQAESSVAANVFFNSWGTNDVRGISAGQESATKNTIVSNMLQVIAWQKANSSFIVSVWQMPLAFLSNDPQTYNYVASTGYDSLAAAAQAKTDVLYQAYRQLESMNLDGVLVLDTQAQFGRECLPAFKNPYNGDQIHQNENGNSAKADFIASVLGRLPAYSPIRSDGARLANPSRSYTLYPRAVEDANYWDMVAQGRWVASANNYIVFSWSPLRAGEILKGDVVAIEGQTPVVITGDSMPQAGNTLLNGQSDFPVVPAVFAGNVTVYRHKYQGDPNIEAYWKAESAYPYRWRGSVSYGGNGLLILNPYPGEILSALRTAVTVNDIIVCEGQPPLALTGATFGVFASNFLRIDKAGTDFSLWGAGSQVAVFGNHAYEDGSTTRQVLPYPPHTQMN